MGQPSLQQFVDACHAKGIFVKLYFTTRELSNRCTEIFALKALPRHEVLFGVDGTSGQEGGGSRRVAVAPGSRCEPMAMYRLCHTYC